MTVQGGGYRLYSDGWCEQWGYYYKGSTVAGAHVTSFYIPFKDTNYLTLLGVLHTGDGGTPMDASDVYPQRTTSAFRLYVKAGWAGYTWKATGYIS